jgi:PHP family Zn ribbon phosphoesterase
VQEELSSIAGEAIAETVVRVRERKAEVVLGYDGVYGQLVVSKECSQAKALPRRVQQLDLTDCTL